MNYDKPMTGIAGQSGRAGPKAPSDTTTGDVPSVTIGHGSVTTSKKQYSPRPAGLLEKTGRAAVAAGLPASVKIEPETVEAKVTKHLALESTLTGSTDAKITKQHVILVTRPVDKDGRPGVKHVVVLPGAEALSEHLVADPSLKTEVGAQVFDKMRAAGLGPCFSTRL